MCVTERLDRDFMHMEHPANSQVNLQQHHRPASIFLSPTNNGGNACSSHSDHAARILCFHSHARGERVTGRISTCSVSTDCCCIHITRSVPCSL